MSHDPTPREMGYYFAVAGIGMEMVLPAVVGMYLDRWLDTGNWIAMSLGLVGFVGGLVHLTAVVNRQDRDESEHKKPPP